MKFLKSIYGCTNKCIKQSNRENEQKNKDTDRFQVGSLIASGVQGSESTVGKTWATLAVSS